MASFDDPEVIFRRRFKRVFREIEFLERKINKKEGWIFTNHLHSKEELLNSEHHKMIYSITEKIGDDAENWYGRGKLLSLEKSCTTNIEKKLMISCMRSILVLKIENQHGGSLLKVV